MNKTELMNKFTRTANRAGLQLKKHSPEILVGIGLIGGVTAAVMACKATPKATGIIEDAKNTINDIHRVAAEPEKFVTEEHPELYTKEDEKKDLTMVYVKTGVELAKTYGPSIVVGAFAVTSILAGHNILRKRYAATTAAYMVLDKNFKDYRNRVIERFGNELDKELRFNIKAKEIEEIVVNEDGTQEVVKTTVNEVDETTIGDYARFFDEWCIGFEKNNPEYNLMTLRRLEDYANDLLVNRGHVLLNDVFDSFGLPRTPIGAVVGWYYDPSDPTRDNFVSFGKDFDHFNTNNPNLRDFVNGREQALLLEFNVDGPIYELIGRKNR